MQDGGRGRRLWVASVAVGLVAPFVLPGALALRESVALTDPTGDLATGRNASTGTHVHVDVVGAFVNASTDDNSLRLAILTASGDEIWERDRSETFGCVIQIAAFEGNERKGGLQASWSPLPLRETYRADARYVDTSGPGKVETRVSHNFSFNSGRPAIAAFILPLANLTLHADHIAEPFAACSESVPGDPQALVHDSAMSTIRVRVRNESAVVAGPEGSTPGSELPGLLSLVLLVSWRARRSLRAVVWVDA